MGQTNGDKELFPPSCRGYDVLMSNIKFACLTCKACGQGRVMHPRAVDDMTRSWGTGQHESGK